MVAVRVRVRVKIRVRVSLPIMFSNLRLSSIIESDDDDQVWKALDIPKG